MDQREEPTQEKTLLLKEYELCQDASQDLESTIWQAGGVVGIGSIGALALVVGTGLDGLAAIVVSIFGILVNVIWWCMARRWWSIQHTKFYRMRHIEEKLGLYQTRYLDYLDALRDPKRTETADDLRKKLLPNDCHVHKDLGEDSTSGLAKRHQRTGVQPILQCLVAFNVIAWITYVLYSVVF